VCSSDLTDITFFDWPVPRERRGTHSIVRTGFRLGSEASLTWWAERLAAEGATHDAPSERDGRPTMEFEDGEGQRLAFVVESKPAGPAHPWAKSPVPAAHQILGLGPITISVPHLAQTDRVLTGVLNFRAVRQYVRGKSTEVHVYEMGQGGPSAELHVAIEPDLSLARQGAGSVHHVAFRTTSDDYPAWAARLLEKGMQSSGPVNRYYFQSLYFREPNGILFEIATDGPGFSVDEAQETLGEHLALPPFLEPRRKQIEAGLKPLV
jgi:glyoxalase family protein